MMEELWPDGARLTQAASVAANRHRFVQEVVAGELKLFFLTQEELLKELGDRGYAEEEHACLVGSPASDFTTDGVARLAQESKRAGEEMQASKKAAADAAREGIRVRMGAVEARKERLASVVSSLHKTKEDLERSSADVQSQVRDKLRAVSDSIATREAELLSVVQRVAQTKKTQLAEHKEDIDTIQKSLAECMSSIDEALAHKNPYDFLEAAAPLSERIDKQLRFAAESHPHTEASLELRLDVSAQLGSIRSIAYESSPTKLGPGAPRANGDGGGHAAPAHTLPAHSAVRAEVRESHVKQALASHQRAMDKQDVKGVAERSQIHLVSPGVEGRERASIITVSARLDQQEREREKAEKQLMGGHRARRGDAELDSPPSASRTDPVSPSRSKNDSQGGGAGGAGRSLSQFVQMGLNGAVLKLSSQRLSASDLSSLPSLLASNQTLTTVDLTDSGVGDEGAVLVSAACAASANVTALGLSGNRLGDSGVRALASTLSKNKSLKSLFLRNNTIGPEGARHLSNALSNNVSLTKLNLKNNKLGAEGATELAPLIATNRVLLEMNIWNNSVGASGATAVAEALGREGAALEELDMGCNAIGCAGMVALAKALRSNRRLERLNLRWNEIEDEGGNALVEAVKENHTMKEIQMFGNKLSDEVSAALEAACAASSGLKVLQ